MQEPILSMMHIEKSFPGVHVLKDVHLALYEGEVHALMGENGAGKSTLMKILLGIYRADGGSIQFRGQTVEVKNPKQALELGISMIHQELNPILDMPIYENIFLGRTYQNRFGIVQKARMIKDAQAILDDMGIDLDVRLNMRMLSVAQCQLIEIAKAISVGASVIIMDEPTSAITETEVALLFKQIHRLKKQGVSILYISHKMDEIFAICDRITVLRDGQYIGSDLAQNLDEDQLIKMMVGRALKDVYPRSQNAQDETVLSVEQLNWGKTLHNVTFELHRGEVLGIAGLVGAGRSEVLECLFGLHKDAHMTIKLMGKAVHFRSPQDAIRHKIAFVTEDRKQTGLNLTATVADNISIVSLRQLFKNGLISNRVLSDISRRYIQDLNIKTPSSQQLVQFLSGGNQQKVVLAKWLLADPDILMLDEPTRGIDIGAKRDIYYLIDALSKNGKSMLVVSSEIQELMGICDRILVMSEGRISGTLRRDEFDQEAIMRLASKFGASQ